MLEAPRSGALAVARGCRRLPEGEPDKAVIEGSQSEEELNVAVIKDSPRESQVDATAIQDATGESQRAEGELAVATSRGETLRFHQHS